jgi:hypothetical protein
MWGSWSCDSSHDSASRGFSPLQENYNETFVLTIQIDILRLFLVWYQEYIYRILSQGEDIYSCINRFRGQEKLHTRGSAKPVRL